jgi:hypothetical protein
MPSQREIFDIRTVEWDHINKMGEAPLRQFFNARQGIHVCSDSIPVRLKQTNRKHHLDNQTQTQTNATTQRTTTPTIEAIVQVAHEDNYLTSPSLTTPYPRKLIIR